MARSDYVYVVEVYPRGGSVAAATVKKELPALIAQVRCPVSVTIFKAGVVHRYIRPFELEEWLGS
jgi:predicted nuclease with RNAse H fold